MPGAFKRAGIIGSFIGVIITGIILMISNLKLLRGYEFVKEKRICDYSSVVEAVFIKSKHLKHRKFAKVARWIANYFMATAAFGYQAVFLLFSAEMAYDIALEYFPRKMNFPLYYYQIAMACILILVSMVTSVRILSFLSMTTSIFTVGSYIIMVAYAQFDQIPIENLKLYPDSTDSILGLGTVVFGMGGCVLVIQLASRMKHQGEAIRWNGPMGLAHAFTTIGFCIVGFYGYVKFGNQSTLFIKDLPKYWLFDILKCFWFVSIFAFYNMCSGILIDITWKPIKHRLENRPKKLSIFIEVFLRIIFVVLNTCLTATVPCLEQWISLVGAFSCSGINLLVPPVVDHIVDCNVDNHKHFRLKVLSNIFHFSFGILATVIGTYEAIREMRVLLQTESCV